MVLLNLITVLSVGSLVSAAPYMEHRKEDKVIDTDVAGGPHGTDFNDFGFVNAQSGHRRISKVTIGPCDGGDLSYLRFEFKDWNNPTLPVTATEHGGIAGGRSTKSLDLVANEHIVNVETWTRKAHVGLKYKTRLTKIAISTDVQQPIECGNVGNHATSYWSTKPDKAFLYFSGASGNSIDNLRGHMIPLTDY